VDGFVAAFGGVRCGAFGGMTAGRVRAGAVRGGGNQANLCQPADEVSELCERQFLSA
jgi:hypothetical protein